MSIYSMKLLYKPSNYSFNGCFELRILKLFDDRARKKNNNIRKLSSENEPNNTLFVRSII